MLKWPKYSSSVLLVCIVIGAGIYHYAPSLTNENIAWLGNVVGGGLFFLETIVAFWIVWQSSKKTQ